MDGIETLQSSTAETKAERIARYKAERRRELAERYGNMEEYTSKYVRRDRKADDASETVPSTTKDNGTEPTYSRRGVRNKAEQNEDETKPEKEATTHLGAESSSSILENVSAVKTSYQCRWDCWPFVLYFFPNLHCRHWWNWLRYTVMDAMGGQVVYPPDLSENGSGILRELCEALRGN